MSSVDVIVHVRFSPDGGVTAISERPISTPPQHWFNYLSAKVGESYQPLSGGRGIFRIARSDVDRFKTSLSSTE